MEEKSQPVERQNAGKPPEFKLLADPESGFASDKGQFFLVKCAAVWDNDAGDDSGGLLLRGDVELDLERGQVKLDDALCRGQDAGAAQTVEEVGGDSAGEGDVARAKSAYWCRNCITC